jgi:uncharacterized protein (DUF488 family)
MTTIYTIGYSTRTAKALAELVVEQGVQQLVDVRRFPGSRRFPHFCADAMRTWLSAAHIDYAHEPDLGGRRKAVAGSPNAYWRNESFRAYADYLSSAEFLAAIDRLTALAQRRITTIMCAEAVPWRCHRQLIADALVVRGFEVLDILGPSNVRPHVLNPHAVVQSHGKLVYPASRETQQLKIPGLG